jgi:hypothetical protein
MNLAQRIVLIVAFVVILGIALFPPWVYIYSYPGCCGGVIHAEHSERPAGYHLIFGQHVAQDPTYLVALFNINTEGPKAPRIPERDRLEFFALRIDGTRLMVQLGVAIILTAILYLALRLRPATH